MAERMVYSNGVHRVLFWDGPGFYDKKTDWVDDGLGGNVPAIVMNKVLEIHQDPFLVGLFNKVKRAEKPDDLNDY